MRISAGPLGFNSNLAISVRAYRYHLLIWVNNACC
jgi:hypothetical protein